MHRISNINPKLLCGNGLQSGNTPFTAWIHHEASWARDGDGREAKNRGERERERELEQKIE